MEVQPKTHRSDTRALLDLPIRFVDIARAPSDPPIPSTPPYFLILMLPHNRGSSIVLGRATGLSQAIIFLYPEQLMYILSNQSLGIFETLMYMLENRIWESARSWTIMVCLGKSISLNR